LRRCLRDVSGMLCSILKGELSHSPLPAAAMLEPQPRRVKPYAEALSGEICYTKNTFDCPVEPGRDAILPRGTRIQIVRRFGEEYFRRQLGFRRHRRGDSGSLRGTWHGGTCQFV
jgi:hypothetical protein